MCGWSGQGTFRNSKAQVESLVYSLFVEVSIHKDSGGSCYTEINCPDLLMYPIQVDGVMGKDFCAYTFSGDSISSGSHVVVTLTVAGVVPNKTAGMRCSPCTCGTCVPSSYCVMIWVPASEIYGADPDCGGFWDTHVLTCTHTTDSSLPQQWTDKSGKPFEVGGQPWSITMHTPSQAEIDAGWQTCTIITRISVLDTQQYSTTIPPTILGYNEIDIQLEGLAFTQADDSRPALGVICKERVGDHGLRRGDVPLGTSNPLLNIVGVNTFTNTDMNGTLKRLDGSTIGLWYIRETCCNTPCIPDAQKCWTGCRNLLTNYGELLKCLGTPLYATIIAPGNAYDGKVVPLLTNPVLPNDILTSGAFTPTFCVQWAGQLSFSAPESCTGGTADAQDPINLSFLLRYNDPHKCEGPIPDDPGGYRLIYSLGRTWCGSVGLAWMRGNDNMTPYGDGIVLVPIVATCSPFRMDFTLPAICCGFRTAGVISSTQPKFAGDAGGTWTLRITQ